MFENLIRNAYCTSKISVNSVEFQVVRQTLKNFQTDVGEENNCLKSMVVFQETFTDPSKKIIYPGTWGGKTAPELFEEMKAQLWYVCLAFVVRCLIGFVWLFVLYIYYQSVKHLRRISSLPENDPEKIENSRYFGKDYKFRWIMIGLILVTITGMWLHFEMTRQALIYGGVIWALCYCFKTPLLAFFNRAKAWAMGLRNTKDE